MDSSKLCSDLNAKFPCEGLKFASWRGGLPAAVISNGLCDAVVTLHGGHVCEFAPKGSKPLLWLSSKSHFEEGKPIRGGIPVCWPWFGGAQQPAHGIARLSSWSVKSASREADGSNLLSLELRSTEDSLKQWPHQFKVVLEVKAGSRLEVGLRVFNTGSSPFSYTGALHTYMPVSKITDVSVSGLEGASFVNQLDKASCVQQGSVKFGFELDRLYTDTVSTCVVDDPGWGRRISISKEGSRSTVVWNPWVEKSARMPDFGDEEYWEMLCVETANAGPDKVEVAPGSSHLLKTVIAEIR